MNKAEFDKFAEEYQKQHQHNIRITGEGPEYFAEYKVLDAAAVVSGKAVGRALQILDFGSGVGNSIPFFRKHLPDAGITCLDVSRKSLDLARSRFSNDADFIEFDGGTVPLADESFDLVFSACVFHHIPHVDHRRLLLEIRRLLYPGGRLMLYEHNPLNPFTVHAVNTCPFDENATLIRAGKLKEAVTDAGFGDVSTAYRVFIPGILKRIRKVEAFLKWLPIGAQYYIIASR